MYVRLKKSHDKLKSRYRNYHVYKIMALMCIIILRLIFKNQISEFSIPMEGTKLMNLKANSAPV